MKLTLTLEINLNPDQMFNSLSPEAQERIKEKENKMFLIFAEESAGHTEKVGKQLAETLSEMRVTWIVREGEFEAKERMENKKMTCNSLQDDNLSVFTNCWFPQFEITNVRLDNAISH